MSFGIQVNNLNGEMLISDAFATPQFFGKLTPTYTGTTVINSKNIHEWSYGGLTRPVANTPYMAIPSYPMNSNLYYYGFGPGINWRNGTTFTQYLYVETPTSVSYTSVPVPDVYVFTLVDHKPQTGYGMQVFNSAGKLMFDSRNKPLALTVLFTPFLTPLYTDTEQVTYIATGGTGTDKMGLLTPYYSALRHVRFSDTGDYIGGVRSTGPTTFCFKRFQITSDGASDSGVSYTDEYSPNIGSLVAAFRAFNYD